MTAITSAPGILTGFTVCPYTGLKGPWRPSPLCSNSTHCLKRPAGSSWPYSLTHIVPSSGKKWLHKNSCHSTDLGYTQAHAEKLFHSQRSELRIGQRNPSTLETSAKCYSPFPYRVQWAVQTRASWNLSTLLWVMPWSSSQFCRWGNWGMDQESDLPKIVQWVSDSWGMVHTSHLNKQVYLLGLFSPLNPN